MGSDTRLLRRVMSLRRFLFRLWNVLQTRRAEQELAREIEAHLTLLEEEFQRQGSTRAEAARAARIALGGSCLPP